MLTHFAVAGFYLAFFFLLSHNFEGVHHIVEGKLVPADDPLGTPKPNTLLRHQVCGASPWLYPHGCLHFVVHPDVDISFSPPAPCVPRCSPQATLVVLFWPFSTVPLTTRSVLGSPTYCLGLGRLQHMNARGLS
jgi:hypothetical protein